MAMFGESEPILKEEGFSLGEFDPTADGFYRNVKTFSFKVKKRRMIRINVTSDKPIDIAVANEKGSSITHKQAVKEGTIGPVPTGDNKEMGIILGIFPGDKAAVTVEVWSARS